jgi:hypothetical protein
MFDLTNLKGEKRRNVGKLNNELNIVNQLVDLHFLLFVNNTGNLKIRLAHTRLRKWCYTPLQHDFALDPIIPPFD